MDLFHMYSKIFKQNETNSIQLQIYKFFIYYLFFSSANKQFLRDDLKKKSYLVTLTLEDNGKMGYGKLTVL